MMAGPVTPLRRSARNSRTAESSPAIAQQNNRDTFERCSPPAISKVNESYPSAKIQTPSEHQNAMAFSHGSRPSISSVDSASTTGSSRQIDRVFDTRLSTPSTDSNPTSPEQDASPEDYMVKLSSPGIDDDYEKLTGDESPLIDREMRKKSSTKLRPGLTPSKLATRLVANSEPALTGTGCTTPPLDNASFTEPDSPSVRRCHSAQRFSLNEQDDMTALPRTGRTSLRPPESLSADKRAREASAPGRLGESDKTGTDLSSTNKGRDEPSEAYMNQDAAERNNGSEMKGKSKTRGRSLKTKDHAIANAETLAETTGTSMDSPAPSNSSSSGTPMTSTNSKTTSRSRKGEVKDKAEIEKVVSNRKSSKVHKGLPEMPKVTVQPTSNEKTSQLPFKRFHNDSLSDVLIREELLKELKRETTKGEFQPVTEDKRIKGYIYYYTLPSCEPEFITESMPPVRHFKVGFTKVHTPPERAKEYQHCHHEKIIHGENLEPLRFEYAGHVEKLILLELREFRYKLPCISHKKEDGSPRNHEEWVKVDQKRLLDVIEKWRRWIIRNRPYDSKGCLRPRWLWKLETLESKENVVALDEVLQPFTAEEELECRKAWLSKQSPILLDEAIELYRLLSKSPRIVIFGFCLYIFCGLSSTIEFVGFLLTTAMILYIVSGR